MLRTNFQASKPSGFEKEGFRRVSVCISVVQTQNSLGRSSLDPETVIWTNWIKKNQTMLYTWCFGPGDTI